MGGIFEIFTFIGAMLYCCCKNRFYKSYMHRELMEKEIDLYRTYYSDLKNKEIAKIADKLMEKEQDAIQLSKHMRSLKLIEAFLITNHHKVLMPLIEFEQ